MFHISQFSGKIEEIIVEAKTVKKCSAGSYKRDESFINGLPEFSVSVREHIALHESEMVELKEGGNALQEIDFINFPPGSVIAFRCAL